jgi:hypothetical protein
MPITPTSTKSKSYQALGIDEIARDIETAFDAINQLEQGGGGSDYTETIVNISSSQLLSLTTIDILPPAGVNKYYEIEKVILEFTVGSTQYTGNGIIGIANPVFAYMENGSLGSPNNWAVVLTPTGGILDTENEVGFQYPTFLNTSVRLEKWSGTIADGDGTLRVKIYHKTLTFGA